MTRGHLAATFTLVMVLLSVKGMVSCGLCRGYKMSMLYYIFKSPGQTLMLLNLSFKIAGLTYNFLLPLEYCVCKCL